MMIRRVLLIAALLFFPISATPQAYAPLVTMRVTTPDTMNRSARPNFKVAIVNIAGGVDHVTDESLR